MTAVPTNEQFTAAALRRIYIGMGVLGLAGSAAALLWKGWRFGAGFAVGAALSGLNFHWLKGAVDALAAAARLPTPRIRAKRVVAKFVLRYALIGAMAYAIFRTSLVSLGAFLAGLFVFVAAVLAEMIYELTLDISHA